MNVSPIAPSSRVLIKSRFLWFRLPRLDITIRRGGIVSWAGLQSDGSIWVQVTGHPLNSCRNSTLLLVHRRGPLSACSLSCLRIETLLSSIMTSCHRYRLLWHHIHNRRICRPLRRIWWWGTLLMSCIHVVVDWRRLSMGRLLVLVHLYRIGRLCCCLCLSLCLRSLCSPLLANRFRMLLLLDTWSRCFAGRGRFEIHGRHEWLCELLLRDKRVQFCLLRRPTFQRIDIEQAAYKVDKRDPIVDF
jgi:hypothetical protein